MINSRVTASLGLPFLLFFAGCGGGNSTPTTPTPAPQAFSQTSTGSLGQDQFVSAAFNVTRAGAARLALSWTGGGNLDLYLTGTACNGNPLTTCQIIDRSQTNQANPEIVTRAVTVGEQFKVWAMNRTVINTTPQNFTLLITIN